MNGGHSNAVLITGGRGTLGQAFARICGVRGLEYCLTSRMEMDICEAEAVQRVLDEARPWAVINTAGYVRVDAAETEVDRCRRENVTGATTLAAMCANRGISFVSFSTDLVFDGAKPAPYVEGDQPNPLNVYGSTKAEAEEAILGTHPGAMVVRTSAFFGPWDRANFVTLALDSMRAGRRMRAASDCVVSPTYVPELVNAVLDLVLDHERGVWHVANAGGVTWADLAAMAADRAGLPGQALVEAVPSAELGLQAQRPRNSALTSERCQVMGSLERALDRYFHEVES